MKRLALFQDFAESFKLIVQVCIHFSCGLNLNWQEFEGLHAQVSGIQAKYQEMSHEWQQMKSQTKNLFKDTQDLQTKRYNKVCTASAGLSVT